jgi:hypothetical protein
MVVGGQYNLCLPQECNLDFLPYGVMGQCNHDLPPCSVMGQCNIDLSVQH